MRVKLLIFCGLLGHVVTTGLSAEINRKTKAALVGAVAGTAGLIGGQVWRAGLKNSLKKQALNAQRAAEIRKRIRMANWFSGGSAIFGLFSGSYAAAKLRSSGQVSPGNNGDNRDSLIRLPGLNASSTVIPDVDPVQGPSRSQSSNTQPAPVRVQANGPQAATQDVRVNIAGNGASGGVAGMHRNHEVEWGPRWRARRKAEIEQKVQEHPNYALSAEEIAILFDRPRPLRRSPSSHAVSPEAPAIREEQDSHRSRDLSPERVEELAQAWIAGIDRSPEGVQEQERRERSMSMVDRQKMENLWRAGITPPFNRLHRQVQERITQIRSEQENETERGQSSISKLAEAWGYIADPAALKNKLRAKLEKFPDYVWAMRGQLFQGDYTAYRGAAEELSDLDDLPPESKEKKEKEEEIIKSWLSQKKVVFDKMDPKTYIERLIKGLKSFEVQLKSIVKDFFDLHGEELENYERLQAAVLHRELK